MRHVLLALALCILIILPVRPAPADGRLEWESPGPWGGFIFRVQVDETSPDRVLVYATRGNFLSADRGETWSKVRHRHHPFTGTAVALSGGKLWVVDEGVLTSSTDGGATWKPDRKLEGQLIGHARVPGEPPETIWAAVRRDGPQRSSVFVLSPGREARMIGQVDALDPRMDHRAAMQAHAAAPSKLLLLLPIYDKGITWIFGSEDFGDSWQHWSAPLHLNAVAPVPGRPDEWLGASSPMDGKPSGLVHSVDGGRTWKEIGDDSRLRMIRILTFHPKTGALLLGSFSEGVLESPDLGKTLIARGDGLGIDNVCSIAVDPRTKDRLYAGTQSGLYRSEDGGKSWKWASMGMTALQSTGLHVLPGNRVLLLEYQQGARISTDGGRTWPAFTPGWKEQYGKPLWAIVRGEVIVVNTAGGDSDAAVSKDAGRTWARCGISKEEWAIGVSGPKSFFGARVDGSILRSRDGVEFSKISGPPPGLSGYLVRVFNLGEDRTVILSTIQCASFDPDTGEIGGFTALPEESSPERAVVDPGNPSVLWLGSTSGRLYRRTFPARTWECALERRGGAFTGLVGDPGQKDRRIACFGDGTLLLSENAGADWAPLETTHRFRTAFAMTVTPDRRLLLVADGSVRILDLATLDD